MFAEDQRLALYEVDDCDPGWECWDTDPDPYDEDVPCREVDPWLDSRASAYDESEALDLLDSMFEPDDLDTLAPVAMGVGGPDEKTGPCGSIDDALARMMAQGLGGDA